MPKYRLKRKKRNKKNSSVLKSPLFSALVWSVLFAVSVWLIWIQWFNGYKGLVGILVSQSADHILGQSAFLMPVFLFYGLIMLAGKPTKKHIGFLSFLTGTIITLFGISTEFDIIRKFFALETVSGGIAGSFLTKFIASFAGTFGAFIFGFVLLWAGLHMLFGISLWQTFTSFISMLYRDWRQWSKARAELKNKISKLPKNPSVPIIQRAGSALITEENTIKKPPKIQRAESKLSSEEKNDRKTKQSIQSRQPVNSEKFKLPPLTLLTAPPAGRTLGPTDEEINKATKKLEDTLASFEIQANVTGAVAGPVVTRYELTPYPGVRVSSIVSLSNDIALAMKARGIRVEAPIPGKDAIGFEIPNEKPAMVYLREILEDQSFKNHKSLLSFALGRYADGAVAYADLERMPHLLVAGATNSGKSICLHSIIASILTKAKPDEVKFLMIDPKRLELTFYENIPHLYDPKTDAGEVSVVTNAKGAVKSLKALVHIMENRYKVFEMAKVKNIESYNRWAVKNDASKCFYIVVIIDELADLMLQTKAAVEDSIQRLAQMARAVGIHLVLCTQRPSVNVITGVIKANLPSRIAMQVTSKTDSRVILDAPGADSLLGKGDMLYLAIDAQKPSRIQGAYVSEEEITALADYLRLQGRPNYPSIFEQSSQEGIPDNLGLNIEEFKTALKLITQRRRVSQDLLKAHFGSSARATNILSALEVQGFIQKPDGSNRWDIQFDKIEHQLNMLESTQTLAETVKNGI